jgi:hypothetical protein
MKYLYSAANVQSSDGKVSFNTVCRLLFICKNYSFVKLERREHSSFVSVDGRRLDLGYVSVEGQREVCFSDKNLKVGVSKYGHVIYGSIKQYCYC